MDEHYPGWERKIDLATLDIGDPSQCVCGQVVSNGMPGGYSRVISILEFQGGNPAELGFAHPCDGDAWVALIKERFDTGMLSDRE
jgi:hypothetical protein